MGAMHEFGQQPMPELRPTRDGRLVLLRAVHERDQTLLDEFFHRLTPASRHRRFHGGVKSLTPALLQRMTRPDPRDELALLVTTLEAGQGACIGEARFAVGDGPPHEREFSLVVADAWQGVGLGTELMRSLAWHARLRGVERLVGDVMRDNLPMIELARRQGYAVRTHPADARLLRVTRAVGAAAVDAALRLAAHGTEASRPMLQTP